MPLKKLKGIRFPRAQRLVYVRFLNDLIHQMREVIKNQLFPTLPILLHRQDSLTWLSDKLEAISSGTTITWKLMDIARQIEQLTQKDFQDQMASVLGVKAITSPSPEKLRALFVEQNARLIKTVPQHLIDRTEQMVLQALRNGSTSEHLEEQLQQQLSLTKQRAQLIARDQVSKYSGDLTRHHQTYAGITHYIWQTSRDERVRPEHQELDGQIFSWDEPAISDKSGGRYHPRQGYNCRCDAIPVVD